MRKIGELKGKPIIEGNPNEIKKNQIHYKESDGNITLSERKEDNTLSSVTSGSGSGEGVKEYYYKFKESMPLDCRMFYQLLLLLTASKIDIIVPFLNNDNKECTGEVSIITIFLSQDLNVSTYFKISDIIFPIVGSVSDRGNHGITTEIYTEGDLFTKLEHGSILLGDDPELLEMLNIVKDNAITITKEEYEAMITYKPE
jgi:hypothetical protein